MNVHIEDIAHMISESSNVGIGTQTTDSITLHRDQDGRQLTLTANDQTIRWEDQDEDAYAGEYGSSPASHVLSAIPSWVAGHAFTPDSQ